MSEQQYPATQVVVIEDETHVVVEQDEGVVVLSAEQGPPGPPGPDTEQAIADHEAAEDPHPQYQTQDESDARYSQLGHDHDADYDPLGAGAAAASAAVAAHEALADPHTQYYNQTRGDARYALAGHNHDASYDALGAASAAVAAHVALGDPHTQYYNQTRGDARYELIGVAAALLATHVAAVDPHTQYLNNARGDARYEVINAVATHVGLADPHTQYLNNARGDARYDALGTAASLLATHAGGTGVHTIAGVTGLQAALDAKVASTLIGAANGVASLDSGGKVPTSQLPSSIMEYKGTWNATTNTPTLSDGTGGQGDVYRVTVGGTIDLGSGALTFTVGDYAVHNGTVWEVSDTTDSVPTVFGRTGNVVAADADYSAGQIVFTPAGNISATRVQAAIEELDAEKQPLDTTLSALAGAAVNTDKLIYGVGVDAVSVCDFTAQARTFVAATTQAGQRTAMGLGTMSTQAASAVAITGGSIEATTLGAVTPASVAATSLTASGLFTLTGVEDNITAFAGGGQANATALSATKNFHRVTTVASLGDSVKLPASSVGQIHYVVNSGSGSSLKIYGTGTDTINGVAAATGVFIRAKQGAFFVCTTAGNWTCTFRGIQGTTNQITATVGDGEYTLSLPQSIDTAAAVQFGSLGLGAAAATSDSLTVGGNTTTGSVQRGVFVNRTYTAGTANVVGVGSKATITDAAGTTNNIYILYADNSVKGASATLTSQYGVFVNDLTSATNNYGIYSNVSSGTNKYNIYAGGTAPNYLAGDLTTAGYLTLPKTSGYGIKVDTATPTFGWRDITSEIVVRGVGANDPTYATYTGTNLRAYQFSASTMNEIFTEYHVPHDYVPGTDIYFHVHWSNAAATPNTGNVVWAFEYTSAKGHGQAAYPATSTISVTQACPATRYYHNIAETAAVTISGLEPDSLILVRLYRDATNGSDTCTDAVFIHDVDVHYQSTNIATKQKAPNFYS